MENRILHRLALNSNIKPDAKAVFLLLAYSAEIMSPQDIAYILNIPVSTAVTACATLFYFGFIEKDVAESNNQYFYVKEV